MSKLESVDERLLALAMRRTGGAKEIFRKIRDVNYILGADNKELFNACYDVFVGMNKRAMILPFDLVESKLKERGTYEDVGFEKIDRVYNAEVSPQELSITIQTILDRTDKEIRSARLEELRDKISSKEVSVDEAAEAAKEMSSMSHSKASNEGNLITFVDVIDEIEHIEELPDCVETGFDQLDEHLGGGLAKGGYHIISSPTGSGKTILMLSMWKNMLDNDVKAIYLNYEIARSLFMKFLFAQLTGCNVWRKHLSEEFIDSKKDEMRKRVGELFEENLLLLSDPRQGAPKLWHDVSEMMRDLIEMYEAEVVFIDTINSINAATKTGQGNRWNEYEGMSISLEGLCQELNPAVVISAQMDRDAEKREDKTPRIGDVAGSKVLSEKASSITHLHRADKHDNTHVIDYSELIITKNRMTGQELGNRPIRVKYDVDHKSLYEISSHDAHIDPRDLSDEIDTDGPFISGSGLPGGASPQNMG